VKAPCARWMTGFVMLGLVVALALSLLDGRPADAANVSVSPVIRRTGPEQVELEIRWSWTGARPRSWLGRQDRLLAVSFDTRHLVMEAEEAPAGKGGDGDFVKQLGKVAGPDGARRLFVIPEGEDGGVRLLFRSTNPDEDPAGLPLRIYVVLAPPDGPVRVQTVESPRSACKEILL
jgi:hypothetical protein